MYPTNTKPYPWINSSGGLNIRNGRRIRGPEGLPENSIRAAGVMEEGGESGQQQRVRAWVDISPSGLMISCSGKCPLRLDSGRPPVATRSQTGRKTCRGLMWGPSTASFAEPETTLHLTPLTHQQLTHNAPPFPQIVPLLSQLVPLIPGWGPYSTKIQH